MTTAAKTVVTRLHEQIETLKQSVEKAKAEKDFESMFLFLDRITELENQMESKEGGVIY